MTTQTTLADRRPVPAEPAAPTVPPPAPRLLLVSAGNYPPDFGGGQLRVHKTLLRMRDRHPLTVEVLALTGASTLPGRSEIDGIAVHRLPATSSTLSLALAIGRQIRDARRRGVDIVYTLAISRSVYLAALWARLLGLPLMVEIVNRSLLEKLSRRLVARLLTRSADLVVAISEPVAHEIRSFGIADAKLWVRPNPVDLELHRLPSPAERASERHRLGYPEDAIVHLVAGSISPRKNQLFAADVIERLDEHHQLLIIGPVLPQNRAYADRLTARVAASPARHRIRFIDRFDDALHRVMRAVDCLWLASKEEGLGNVMLEALCCGVPCIINRDLGMQAHVTSGENGWQAALDPTDWVQAVRMVMPLIEAPAERAAISEAARRRYDSARFDDEFHNRLLALAGHPRPVVAGD